MRKGDKAMRQLMAKLSAVYKAHREGVDYLFWGAMATLLNILLLPVFMALGLSASDANLLDLCLCILFTYATNRRFVFRSRTKGAAAVREFFSFLLARAVTGVFDQCFIVLTVERFGPQAAAGLASALGWFGAEVWAGLWAMGCKVVSNVVVILLNFVFSKLFIFKKKSGDSRTAK